MTHKNTFEPAYSWPERLNRNLAVLKTALRQIVKGYHLNEVVERGRASYLSDPLRLRLLAFEKEILEVRRQVAQGKIRPGQLRPDLQEWAVFDRKTFFIQLRLLYHRQGFFRDVDRVIELSQKGVKLTSEVKDHTGKVVGSETVSDDAGQSLVIDF